MKDPDIYQAIAQSLVASYPSVTVERVAIVHARMRDRTFDIPRGSMTIVDRFIQRSLLEAFPPATSPMVGQINAGEVTVIEGDVHGGITL